MPTLMPCRPAAPLVADVGDIATNQQPCITYLPTVRITYLPTVHITYLPTVCIAYLPTVHITYLPTVRITYLPTVHNRRYILWGDRWYVLWGDRWYVLWGDRWYVLWGVTFPQGSYPMARGCWFITMKWVDIQIMLLLIVPFRFKWWRTQRCK